MSIEISIWTCKYCGKDTSEVEYDYLSGYDHLGCTLQKEMKSEEMDCCVLCGAQTLYVKSVDINYRHGYIEGAGQLCKACYDRGTDRKQILVPANIIYNTPNDMELGAKVRQLYNATENNS